MSEPAASPEGPVFAERPTEFIVKDAFVLGAIPLALAGVAGALGWHWLGGLLLLSLPFLQVLPMLALLWSSLTPFLQVPSL